MGKTIIIKGADFSENAIQELRELAIDCNSDIELADTLGTVSTGSPFADARYANLYDKHLVGVELKPALAGSLTIVSLYDGVLTDIATINITSDMVGIKTYFKLNVEVRQNEIIGIGKRTDTGSFYYYKRTSAGFIIRLGRDSQTISYGLAVNWYVSQ